MSMLLAIDLGTSSVKVLLLTEAGQVAGRSSAEYPLLHPQPNYAEQNPEDWWQAITTATRQALTPQQSNLRSIAAIGLSGQMHGTVLLDRHGQLIAPAIAWPDQRSGGQVQEITDLFGTELLAEITGGPVATGFQAATIRWIQQHRPEVWRRVHTILLPKDYVRWRLCGHYHTDPSDASGTGLFNGRDRAWDAAILAKLEIDKARLPPIQPSIGIAGQLQPAAAQALGLPSGIPVVTGAADTACSVLGSGVIQADTLLFTLSSGGQLVLPSFNFKPDRQGRIHTFCAALEPAPGQAGWYNMAAILAAGLALRWLRDNVLGLSGADAYRHMMAMAQKVPPGARGLLFAPDLAGRRTPHMDPGARGVFLGLAANHGQAELIRAVIEGVTFACYDAYQTLATLEATPKYIVLGGGGARSRLWQQIIADLFDLPVRRLKTVAQSAVGATLLAGAAVNLFNPAEMAPQWAAYEPQIEPIPANTRLYHEFFEIYATIYHKHQDDFKQLQQLTSPTVGDPPL